MIPQSGARALNPPCPATTKQMEYESIPKIPSELIEPHLAAFLGQMIKEAAYGDIAEIKQMIRGAGRLVGLSCGVHAKIAFSNQAYKFTSMPDDELQALCRQIVEGEFDNQGQ